MEPEVCGFAGCRTKAEASFGDDHICLEHFIFSCFRRLDECERWLDAPDSAPEDPDRLQRMLADFARQANDLSKRAESLSNLERARLSYIQVVAGDLSRRLRRSPRKIAAIPLRICGEKTGFPWVEETQTKTISRRGALLECQQPLAIGDKLIVERVDSGEQARGRVVWHRTLLGGQMEVGLEFTDREDFWELDWDAVKSER